MNKSISMKHHFVALLCVSVIGVAGCAKQDVASSESTGLGTTATATAATGTTAETQQENVSNVSNVSPQALTGIWFGSASLNSAKLQEKLFSVSPEQQNLIAAKAQSFLSTIMAIEFSPDGTVRNEIEFQSIDGQTVRDSSDGNWSVTDAKPNGLLVETRETLQDGTPSKTEVFYQFLEDGKIAISLPVTAELEGCDSVLVFERRTLESTNVAEAPAGTQPK